MSLTISVDSGMRVQGDLFADKKAVVANHQYTIGSEWMERAKAQLPTSWLRFAVNTSLNFSDFCRDSSATKYENGKRADNADLQSRWRTILWWRAKK